MNSKKSKKMKVFIIFLFVSLLATAGSAILLWQKTIQERESPSEMLERYMACLKKVSTIPCIK